MAKKNKNVIGEFLKQKRIAAGLSQADVAEKMGYSTPQFISNWERGVSHPPINALKKLAEIYTIPYRSLKSDFREAAIKDFVNSLDRKLDSAFS
ncbi:helix-turn-helix domain-containing protein [Bdellovibrio sp. BCCA]|uniref:helix-turn-helix domain-containing protein n=1 Tax=Bdellovibrio sp. BCCA TaxID=3136281 RepID=UPI0030F2ADC5